MHTGARGRTFPLKPSDRHPQFENHKVADDRRVQMVEEVNIQELESTSTTSKIDREDDDRNVWGPVGFHKRGLGV